MLSSKFWKIELNLFSRKSRICFRGLQSRAVMEYSLCPVAYAESFRGGGKVLSQSCDVTNQFGECRRNDHYKVVRGHAAKKFCKITPKNTHFRTGQIGSFSKTKKAFAYASKSRANPEYLRKTSFAFPKTAWFCFTVFHF